MRRSIFNGMIVVLVVAAATGCASNELHPVAAHPTATSSIAPENQGGATVIDCTASTICVQYVQNSARGGGQSLDAGDTSPIRAEFRLKGSVGTLILVGACATYDVPISDINGMITVRSAHTLVSATGCTSTSGKNLLGALLAPNHGPLAISRTERTLSVAEGSVTISFTRE